MTNTKYKIIQIMPPNGWVAVFWFEDKNGGNGGEEFVPLIAWALATNNINEEDTDVVGVILNQEGESTVVQALEDFIRYEPSMPTLS